MTLRKILVTGSLLLWAVEAFSQIDTAALRARHEADPRDVKALAAYADALEQAGEGRQAEALVREFMAHCPVTQIEDRDTYLLISRYVFDDPYSNVFDYALFLMPRMKWDSTDLTPQQKAERTRRSLADLRWGVSHGDEVDKRYEVMSLLGRRLGKAVGELCDPRWQQDGSGYTMPARDEARMSHLARLVDKGNIPGRDALRTKLRIAEAIHAGDTPRAMRYLCTASALDMQGINGTYLTGMMYVLAGLKPDAASVGEAIDALTEQCRISEARGSGSNYYTVLGMYYRLAGDDDNARRYTDRGAAVEAERQALYDAMMNPSTN